MQTRDQKLVSRFPNQNCKSNKPVAHIKCWSYGFLLAEEFWIWSRNLSQILSTLHHWEDSPELPELPTQFRIEMIEPTDYGHPMKA